MTKCKNCGKYIKGKYPFYLYFDSDETKAKNTCICVEKELLMTKDITQSSNFCVTCNSRFNTRREDEDDDFKYYRCTKCDSCWKYSKEEKKRINIVNTIKIEEKKEKINEERENSSATITKPPLNEVQDLPAPISTQSLDRELQSQCDPTGETFLTDHYHPTPVDDISDNDKNVDVCLPPPSSSVASTLSSSQILNDNEVVVKKNILSVIKNEVPKPNKIDTLWQYEALKENTRQLLDILGVNKNSDQFQATPGRVSKAWIELTTGYRDPDFSMTLFPSTYDGIVYRKGIPFTSLCAHHLQPFTGTIDFAYIPNGKIVGISKIIRYCQYMAAKMTVQEELTKEILDGFTKIVQPKGCIVIIEAYHSCESNRGVKVSGVPTGTSERNGLFETNPDLEERFYTLLGRRY